MYVSLLGAGRVSGGVHGDLLGWSGGRSPPQGKQSRLFVDPHERSLDLEACRTSGAMSGHSDAGDGTGV